LRLFLIPTGGIDLALDGVNHRLTELLFRGFLKRR
jgi:hypothetical protein